MTTSNSACVYFWNIAQRVLRFEERGTEGRRTDQGIGSRQEPIHSDSGLVSQHYLVLLEVVRIPWKREFWLTRRVLPFLQETRWCIIIAEDLDGNQRVEPIFVRPFLSLFFLLYPNPLSLSLFSKLTKYRETVNRGALYGRPKN